MLVKLFSSVSTYGEPVPHKPTDQHPYKPTKEFLHTFQSCQQRHGMIAQLTDAQGRIEVTK